MGKYDDPERFKDTLIAHLRDVHKAKNMQYPSHWTKVVLVELHRDIHKKESAS